MVKAQSIAAPATGVDAVRIIRESSSASSASSALSKEQVQIQMYLSKLKELVPHMPKNRRVSKLEVIQHVIDYICDLQSALEQNRPSIMARHHHHQQQQRRHHQQQQQQHRQHQQRNRSHSASDAGLAPFVASSVVVGETPARQPLGILSAVSNNIPTDAGNKDI